MPQSSDLHSVLSAEQSLERLMDGNARYVAGKSQYLDSVETRRKELVKGQAPFATILACSDSRVPVEILFDQGLGDIFVIRVAGNTVDDFVQASLDFATGVLKTPLVMVLGHEECGAVIASLAKETPLGALGSLVKQIRGAIKEHDCPPENPLSCAIQDNVKWVVKEISASQPTLAPLLASGKVKIQGAVYDLESGKVELMNPS